MEVILNCGVIKFCHLFDEDAFFDWIKKIPSIIRFEYPPIKIPRDELHLMVKSNQIPDEDLRAIIGLFYKYDIDMKQLKVFAHEGNKTWMQRGRPSYWSPLIFAE